MSMQKMRNRSLGLGSPMLAAAITVAGATSAYAGLLTTESFSLPYGPGNAAAAPYMDMVLNTLPLSTWSEKGAVGLQGPNAFNPNDPGNATAASIVAFKFNIGATVDYLNATYGAGNWTITAPAVTLQYTYYANNGVFGGGAGTFETYWVANDSWAFNGSTSGGNATYNTMKYVAGTDPVYATSGSSLLAWAGTEADLGSTTYNWLSPANNPNYSSWSTDKTGANQGLLTDTLTADPLLVNDIAAASAAANPNLSLYLIPTSSTLGLCIFTGGGSSEPTLSFDVVSVPEPTFTGLAAIGGISALLRRRRRS